MERRRHVVVIGGGISGLATAAFLRRDSHGAPDVTVIEADARLGGKVLTHDLCGLAIDTGPDAFLVRVPAMARLLADLGFDDDLVAPAALGSYVWSRGRLRRLPTGTVFGIPDRMLPLARSGLISPPGLLRAGLDLVLPRRELGADPTVEQLLLPRFGKELVERLVEPLLGGVHAGSTQQLSAASTVPDIEALARGERSLFRALRRRRRGAPPATGPTLVSLEGGLERLITALLARLGPEQVLTGRPATAIERAGHGFRVSLGRGELATTLDADAVVVATPAFVAAELLRPLLPAAADALAGVPYADVATVTLAYPRAAVSRPLDATGFLVPPVEGRLLVGCSWLSAKWAHLGAGPSVVIRAMVGRAGDRRWVDLDDDALVARVHAELVEAIGLSTHPEQAHVQRWPRAIPQYVVGHRARIDEVDQALVALPGLHLTGAAYRGVGIAGCVQQAEQTAGNVLAQLPTSSREALA